MDEPGPTAQEAQKPQPARPAGGPWVRKVFLGRQGIRSGWRLLLFLLVAGVVIVALRLGIKLGLPALAQFLRYKEGEPFDPRVLAISELLAAAAILFSGWVMSRVERRPFGSYGLPAKGAFGLRFWEGFLWGILFACGLYALLALEGGFVVGGLAPGAWRLLGWGLLWALAAVGVGIVEEFTFRGYGQHTLAQGIGFLPAVLVLSTVFGLGHLPNPGEGWAGALSAGVFGLFFCFTLVRTGNLWFAVGMHAAFDFGETFLFAGSTGLLATRGHLLDAAVHGPQWLTGGSVGPEASVNGLILFPVLFLAFHMAHRDTPGERL